MGHKGAVRFSPADITDDEDIETAIETAIEAVMDVAELATKCRVAASRLTPRVQAKSPPEPCV